MEFTAYNGYLVFEIIELKAQRGMQIRNELVDNIEIRFSLIDEAFLGCISVHTIASVSDPRFKMLKVMGQKFPGAEEEILLTIVAEIDKLNDNQTEADVLEQQAVQLEVIQPKVPRLFGLECEFEETPEPHLENSQEELNRYRCESSFGYGL